jgi:hypothetical protein
MTVKRNTRRAAPTLAKEPSDFIRWSQPRARDLKTSLAEPAGQCGHQLTGGKIKRRTT